MNNNPFLSDKFSSLWSKHFHQNIAGRSFGFINGPTFFKPFILPLYINIGKNITKGISYKLINGKTTDHKKKVFLIYDVPKFFDIDTSILPKNIDLYKIKQYPGFLIDLEAYSDLNNYMTSTFSKSSRYKLNKYKKRLEISFEINYKMFFGEISKTEYDWLFGQFKKLLQKRFSLKQTTNNNLNPKEWDFYHEVAYPMILEKKASLFVIYNGRTPIGITLSYFSDDVLFDAITVFDVDYTKFHVGSVTIMKLIEWCLEQKLKVLDFSKGYFDYKKRWASKEYDFEYHILYDSKSLVAKVLASTITLFFKFKQFLRDKNVNEKLHRITCKIRNKPNNSIKNIQYKFFEVSEDYQKEEFVEINYSTVENKFLKTIAFDFLYLKNESQKNIKLYRSTVHNNQFLFLGIDNRVMVEVI